MPSDRVLPYGRQTIEDDDVAAVADALRAEYLTTGPAVDAFEKAFAERVGASHAVACSSGTAALHLAVLALGIGPGDWVVVPSMTFLASANVARLAGAEVQFSDVDPDRGLVTEDSLREALVAAERAGRSVAAVMPVHLSGRTAPLAALSAICEPRGVPILEDACHALGTTHDGVRGPAAQVGDGRYGRLAAFSFHPVKTIAVGEGGMVTTNDGELACRMRRLRSHGMVRHPAPLQDRALGLDADGTANPWYYEMDELGLNYRLPDVLCALGLSQLAKLDRFVARRRALAALYDRALAPLAPLVRPVPPVADCDPALHLYAVLIDFETAGRSRRRVMEGLRARGIGTQVHYIPVHHQPYYRARYGQLQLPGADAYYARELSLPLFPGMCDDDVHRVVTGLEAVLAGR
ncbi:MAG: UDP-4-amino-4,6-dideoxy-N-acetyl-beta-L-altrosamine transaminase [Deltaproteobacteria bacterium]|nr:UDP-4-amino-4,6-dideoxy-N-acetyl-beta-L-altrosamine transaminase [Deltaproteobacteria bacterium]